MFIVKFLSVTPFAGVWIEIDTNIEKMYDLFVTPFAGVWIEITVLLFDAVIVMSLPSRECGLKLWQDSNLD